MDIDKIIDIIHTLKEEGGPTMSLGSGAIAGTVEAGDDPPVDLRRRKERGWNIFFRDFVKQKRKKKKKRKS
jgi:uncharacterized ParB-like nuclease family protein